MDWKFYLISDKRLFCYCEGMAYEYINDKWEEADGREILNRLIGYDPYEPDDSPYKTGNLEILEQIKKLSQEEVIEKYGNEVIDKIKDIDK